MADGILIKLIKKVGGMGKKYGLGIYPITIIYYL